MHPVTKKYIYLSFVVLIFVNWSVSAAYISNYISIQTGFDPLSLIGSGGVLGPKKILALEYLAVAGVGVLLVGCIFTAKHPGMLVRLAVLSVIAPIILATHLWLNVAPLGQAQKRINIVRLSTVDYDAIFNDEQIKRGAIRTYAEFQMAVDRNFERHRDVLSERWGIQDEQKLRVFFYLNTVSNLFSFGNQDIRKAGGCAGESEQFGGKKRSYRALGVRFFTESEIGCCTDFAQLIKLLLDGAGMESRIVAIHMHGHVFNEVQLGGKWHALDANIGGFYDRSWNAIVDSQEPFFVTVFPVLSLKRSPESRYRPVLAQFRHATFMVAATGAERSVPANHETLPMLPGQ